MSIFQPSPRDCPSLTPVFPSIISPLFLISSTPPFLSSSSTFLILVLLVLDWSNTLFFLLFHLLLIVIFLYIACLLIYFNLFCHFAPDFIFVSSPSPSSVQTSLNPWWMDEVLDLKRLFPFLVPWLITFSLSSAADETLFFFTCFNSFFSRLSIYSPVFISFWVPVETYRWIISVFVLFFLYLNAAETNCL